MKASWLVGTALAALALPLLTGCGDDTTSPGADASQTPTTVAAEGPACDEVWVAEQAFPADYDGCVADGSLVPADPQDCTTGQTMYTYDNRFYAAGGGKVIETEKPLDQDERYQSAFNACTA